MPLVERLMGLNADGSVPTGDPDRPKIPVHDFFAAANEIVAGAVTVANVKTAFSMNTSEEDEMDELVALAPTGTSATALANKALYVSTVHSVFILAEKRIYTGYITAANIRTRLGLPTPP